MRLGLTFVRLQDAGTETGFDLAVTEIASSSTPEPSTWALMLVGFAGLGFVAYRRAKKGRASLVAA
jgi:hypothetical protein